MVKDFVEKANVFQTPTQLAELLERHRANVARRDLYGNPRYQPVRDAWQAILLALGYEEIIGCEVEVRICAPDDFPDFQMRVGGADGEVFDFEAVMALETKLGEKYRGDQTKGPQIPVRPEQYPVLNEQRVREVLRKKVGKTYGPGVNLAVYLNLKGGNVEAEALSSIVLEETGGTFESVWMTTYEYISCAKPSSLLAKPEGWIKLPLRTPEELRGVRET